MLSIVVATVDRAILANRSLLSIPLHQELQMVVVNQMIADYEPQAIDSVFCKVINTKERGLSKSRNKGLGSVDSGHAIIADDDVCYTEDFEAVVLSAIQGNEFAAALTFRIQTPEGRPYRKYSKNKFVHNWRSVLKVSSISVAFNINQIKDAELRFDEDFGLGAKYPTGEENIFLNDMLKRGLRIVNIPQTIVVHPAESSGNVMSQPLFFSKGAMFRRLYGWRGLVFAAIFALLKGNMVPLTGTLARFKSTLNGFISYKGQ